MAIVEPDKIREKAYSGPRNPPCLIINMLSMDESGQAFGADPFVLAFKSHRYECHFLVGSAA